MQGMSGRQYSSGKREGEFGRLVQTYRIFFCLFRQIARTGGNWRCSLWNTPQHYIPFGRVIYLGPDSHLSVRFNRLDYIKGTAAKLYSRETPQIPGLLMWLCENLILCSIVSTTIHSWPLPSHTPFPLQSHTISPFLFPHEPSHYYAQSIFLTLSHTLCLVFVTLDHADIKRTWPPGMGETDSSWRNGHAVYNQCLQST